MTNPASLENKVIIVTGAAQGIGKALTDQAVLMGARVAALDINEGTLKQSLVGHDAKTVKAYAGDITDESFVAEVIADAAATFGDVHGLVNNAGIVRAALITEMSRAQWQSFACRLSAVILLIKQRGAIPIPDQSSTFHQTPDDEVLLARSTTAPPNRAFWV